MQWRDPVRSQAGVGIAGVLLLSITVAAGLGFCALLGEYFVYKSFLFPFSRWDLLIHVSKTYRIIS